MNRYDVIQLNPSLHPTVKATPAQQLAGRLAGPEGQAAIGAYTTDGKQLFHPDADDGCACAGQSNKMNWSSEAPP